MRERLFVDCHSHVVPSGDDGASTVAEGRALCASAARHGTRRLYATPHVWPDLTLTPDREAQVRQRFAAVAASAAVEVRLGYELTPSKALLRQDPWRYALGGTSAVLMEVPFAGPADTLFALAEHAQRQGLQPVIAHPERSEAGLAQPELAVELAARGCLLQVNATSLLGRHGPEEEALAWRLVEDGHASLVASDGHRTTRPAHLDEAYEAVAGRIGASKALPLFDGSALEPFELRTARAVAGRS